jgi:hypothetical protein
MERWRLSGVPVSLTIIVGAIKHPDPKDQDGVDQGIENGTQFDVKSKSAKDFYDGIKKIYDACVEKHPNDAEACCIKKLVLDGHSTAGLGGGETLDNLTAAEIADLKKMLCKDATIVVLGCFAFHLNTFPQYKLHLDLAMLLAEKGGTYEGYQSMTRKLYPKVESTDPNEKKPSKLRIPKGAKEDDVKKGFKKISPTGQD